MSKSSPPDANDVNLEYGDPWDFYFEEYRSFFRKAFQLLNFNGITGDYVEFGCHKARTFSMAYHANRNVLLNEKYQRHFWAFDSFQGLPEPASDIDSHPMWRPGSYCTNLDEFIDLCLKTHIPRKDFTLVPGFYSDTLSASGKGGEPPADIGLVFVDCDMYSSTQAVLDFLERRLKHGMIIAFDDYFCYSKDQSSGEKTAFTEFTRRIERFSFIEYCNFHFAGKAYIVEKR